MSATPGAKNEYSRGSGASGGSFGGDFGGSDRPLRGSTAEADRGARALILAGALIAALLLVVAEFTTLYQVHVATSSTPVKSVTGGSNHSYAMIPIAILAAFLGLVASRSGSRTALLAIGGLGVVALLIALVGDLPNSHATGLAGSARAGYVNASSTPSAGLYMETLGGVLLIATCGLGLLMGRTPRGGGGDDDAGGPGAGPGDGGAAGPGAGDEPARPMTTPGGRS